MSDNHASKVAERYNQIAIAYRDLWAPTLRIAGKRLLRELISARRGATTRVVDVGTGVGTLMPEISSAFPGAGVLGLDRSPGMLALAPRDNRMHYAVADAREMPLGPGSADVVVMAFMLFHLPQPADGLREARRVLRSGGCVGTITWGGEFESNATHVWTECLDQHGAAAPDPGLAARDEPLNTGPKMQALLTVNGFSNARGWTEDLVDRMELEHLLQFKTRMSSEKPRFDSLSETAREECITTARRRMQSMRADDFVCTAKLVFAVAS